MGITRRPPRPRSQMTPRTKARAMLGRARVDSAPKNAQADVQRIPSRARDRNQVDIAVKRVHSGSESKVLQKKREYGKMAQASAAITPIWGSKMRDPIARTMTPVPAPTAAWATLPAAQAYPQKA